MAGSSVSNGYAAYSEGATADRPGFVGGVDLSLAASVTARDLFRHFFLRWWVVGFLTWLFISLPLSLLMTLGASTDSGDPGGALAGGFFLQFVIPFVAAWASLFIPLRIGNSQYSQLLDGQAGAAESAYGNIYVAARGRAIPATISGRRIAASVGAIPRNYLVVHRDQMQVWVLVMASGVDLWVAWSAWVRHLPVTMPWFFAKQRVQGLMIKGSDFYEALRLNELKAVQWAVHASVIDGVDATLAGQETTVLEAFGYDIPLEPSTRGSLSVPVPVPFPTGVPPHVADPVPNGGAGQVPVPVPVPNAVPTPKADTQAAPTQAAPTDAAPTTSFCATCGNPVSGAHRFCESCGTPVPGGDGPTTLTISVNDLPPSS